MCIIHCTTHGKSALLNLLAQEEEEKIEVDVNATPDSSSKPNPGEWKAKACSYHQTKFQNVKSYENLTGLSG